MSQMWKRTSLSDKVIVAAVGFEDNVKAQQKLQTAFNKQAAEQGFTEKTRETEEQELPNCPFCNGSQITIDEGYYCPHCHYVDKKETLS